MLLFKHFSYRNQPWVALFYNDNTFICPRDEGGRRCTYHIGPHSFKIEPREDGGVTAHIKTIIGDGTAFEGVQALVSTPDLDPNQRKEVDRLLAEKEKYEEELRTGVISR